MEKPQGDLVARLREHSWRRGALRVGYLVLVFAGLELLANRDWLGAVYVLAGGLGLGLAHRRVYSVLVWSGVAVHGAWLFVNDNQLGLWAVAGGAAAAIVGWLPEPALRLRGPLVDVLESVLGGIGQGRSQALSLEPAVAIADGAPRGTAVLEPITSAQADEPGQAEEAALSDVLVIRSIGCLQLHSADRDVTADFEKAGTISFTWLYLMARAVIDSGFLTRKEVAHALAPEKVVVEPYGRLRDHLRGIKKLPEPIARVIEATPELVRFDPDACDWDVARLRRLRTACAGYGGDVVPRELLAELERELGALAPGEFVPGWDVKELSILYGHPHEDLIRDVRLKVSTLRADLTATLGASLLAHGRAADAVAPLEAELARSADPRVVESLIKALHETGQHDRAAELRRKFDRGEA